MDSAALVEGDWKLVFTPLRLRDNGMVPVFSHPRFREWLIAEAPSLAEDVLGTRAFPVEDLDLSVLEAMAERMPESLRQPKLELFNLRTDRGEIHDVAAEFPELVERLARRLVEMQAQGERYRMTGDAAPTLEEVDAETRAWLQALGYADDE